MSKIKISDIQVNKRIREDLGNIETLAKNIEAEGIITPITVKKMPNGKYLLLAGERRLQASKKAGLTHIEAYIKDDANSIKNIEIEIAENAYRKSFDRYELVKAGRELEAILKLEAAKRQKAGKAIEPDDNGETGRVDDIVADRLQIGSGEQYRRFKKIVDNRDLLTDEEFTAWRIDDISTNKALNIIKEREQDKQETNQEVTEKIVNSLNKWKTSFKNANKTIALTIQNFQDTHIPIFDQDEQDISGALIEELQNYLSSTESILSKINSITLEEDGSLFLDSTKTC